MTIYASNGWIATYSKNDDGSLYANITDRFGKQYAYHMYFESEAALVSWLNSK